MQRSGLGRIGERVASAWTGTPEEFARMAAGEGINQDGTLKARERRILRSADSAKKARTTRRWLIGVGIPVTAAGIYFAASELPALISEFTKSDEDRLLEETGKMGIRESASEKALWAEASVKPFEPAHFRRVLSPRESAELSDIAVERMSRVAELMPDSENPLIASAGNFLYENLDIDGELGLVTINTRDGSPARNGQEPSYTMGIGTRLLGPDKINLFIAPTLQRVLISTAQEIALQLVHEGTHMARFQMVLSEMGSDLLTAQKYNLLVADTKANWNQREAEAYGTQYLAYVNSYGLTREAFSAMNPPAVALINRGRDIQSQSWLKYTASNLVSKI